MDTAATTLAQLIAALDAPALLALFILGLMRGWWVMGGTHADVLKQRDRLLEIVLNAVEVLREAAEELKERAKATPTGRRRGPPS